VADARWLQCVLLTPALALGERGNVPPTHGYWRLWTVGRWPAKAPEDWAHSRTLARERMQASAGSMARLRMAAGCQPAIPPINNRRHGVGGLRLLPANSMNYQIPSLRVKGLSRESGRREAAAVQPVRAPEEVAAGRRAICEGCEHRAGEGAAARCRLFGCCHKDLSQTVKLAFQQCPAGRWPRRVPNTLIL